MPRLQPRFRAVMYSHDTLGLGHLTRTLRLARAIVEGLPGSSVLVLTGSPLACRVRPPRGVEFVKLPSVAKRGPEDYVPRDLAISFRRIREMRARMIREAVRFFRPHALYVDNVPLGMKREMLPTLEDVRRRLPDARVHLNLRDVLDDPQVIRERWREDAVYEVLDELYDEILVFGDPGVHDSVAEYGLPAAKTRFLGYVAPYADEDGTPPLRTGSNGGPKILVTIGGGEDGVGNVLCALAFQRELGQRQGFSLDVIAGPFLSADARRCVDRDLRGLEGVRLHEYVPHLSGWMPEYDAVISMGGYNTLCEIMTRARRSIVIPRIYPRREQEIRARAFEARGLLRVLHPLEISPEGLAHTLSRSLEDGPLLPSRAAPSLEGVERFRAALVEVDRGRAARGVGPPRRTTKHGTAWALMIALTGLLQAGGARSAELRPRSVEIDLQGGYDSNLLDASDAEIRAFETGDTNSFFVVDHMEDWLVDLGLEGRWDLGRLWGAKSELRVGYERLQYVRETIKSENRYSLDWRSRLGPGTRLRLEVEYDPQIYGRHRRDKDALPGEPLFRAEVQRHWDGALTVTRSLSGGWQWESGVEGTVRDYVRPFDERDRKRVGAITGLSKTLSGETRFALGGRFRRTWSRNHPYLGSDLSYREWSLQPVVENLKLPGRALLRAHAQVDWRGYTSSDPNDQNHFGRDDTELELGAEITRPLLSALAWKATYVHRKRTARIAGDEIGSFDEEGSFSEDVATTGFAWTWTRKEAQP